MPMPKLLKQPNAKPQNTKYRRKNPNKLPKDKKPSQSPRRDGNTGTQRAFFVLVALVACAIACGAYLKTALGDPFHTPDLPIRTVINDQHSAAKILAIIEAPGDLSPIYREVKTQNNPPLPIKGFGGDEKPTSKDDQKPDVSVAEAIQAIKLEKERDTKKVEDEGKKSQVDNTEVPQQQQLQSQEEAASAVHGVQETEIPAEAPLTSIPVVVHSPEQYIPRVVEELRTFFIAKGLTERADQAGTMVKRVENNPKTLYVSLKKRYGEVREDFPSLIEWAGLGQPPTGIPIPETEAPETQIPETAIPDTAQPISESGRLTVGDKVQLSRSAANRAKRDGAIKGSDVGVIIEDQMDSQPYRIRGPTGKVYWYKESDIVPAGTIPASADKNSDKNPIPGSGGRGGGGRSRGGGRGNSVSHSTQVTVLDVGYHVTAAHDFKVGDAIVVQQGSPGVVSEVKSDTKYKVRFLGEFGLNSPVILTVSTSDVVFLRAD